MAASDSRARPITTAVQLLVEGRTSEIFFREITEQLGMTNIQVRDFGSVEELDVYLSAFVRRPEFEDGVHVLGIIRDAEQNAATGAFQSVRASLGKIGLPQPASMNIVEGAAFKVGVFILPDCERPGMLETLCLSSVQDRPEFPCVDDFFRCVTARREAAGNMNDAKVKASAFVAAHDLDFPTVGRAAQKKIWRWDHPAFANLVAFLRTLNGA